MVDNSTNWSIGTYIYIYAYLHVYICNFKDCIEGNVPLESFPITSQMSDSVLCFWTSSRVYVLVLAMVGGSAGVKKGKEMQMQFMLHVCSNTQ